MRQRVFDHLDVAPANEHPRDRDERIEEDRHFSRVASRMRSSEWWVTVPSYEVPPPRAGTLDERLNRGYRAIERLSRLPRGDLAVAIHALREKRPDSMRVLMPLLERKP